MRLDGIHHITAITGDAPSNVEFYVSVLGLRLVKKTVNFDVPEVYHLYYGDELGHPGSVLTFFEFPGIEHGRAGAGMVHTISWRVATTGSLEFWKARLDDAGVSVQEGSESLRFQDPEGLGLEIVLDPSGDLALRAASTDIPAPHALAGFEGARAYASDPDLSSDLLTRTLGFEPLGGAFRAQGDSRRSSWGYDAAPAEEGIEGAGTVHHIAWACEPDDQEAWRGRVEEEGMTVTPIIDRTYFRSIYFREPSGVLFEIATKTPGFTVDEIPDELGSSLQLPERYEDRRSELEERLTPLPEQRRA